MEAIDETLLNDDNDEDLDYDLDPKEESALLQEDADFLVQEFEDEDVLDINVDYDQMDVTEDKLDSSPSDKSKIENRFRRDNDAVPNKRNSSQIYKIGRTDKTKNINRVYKRGAVNTLGNHVMKRSKTVLLNPRFKGPVQVHGQQLAWESPPPLLNQVQKTQQYISPWSSSPYTSQAVQQNHVPVNNYNTPQFLPNNSFMFVQQQHQMLQPQSFTQPQVFMNPPPVMNQTPLLNHSMIPQQPPFQMEHCLNSYHTPQIPQIQASIQQIPETPKLPVHQRLGLPMSNFNSPPSNQMRYDNNQGFQNQMPFENNQYTQFPQTPFSNHEQMGNVTEPRKNNNNFSNRKFESTKCSNFNRKCTGNQGVNNNGNIKVLLSPKKTNNSMKNQKPVISDNQQPSGNVENSRIENSSTIVVVPEDEDEETRQYRIKIEEQKRKREEVLRKKEENRLKNLSDVNTDAPISTVVRNMTNRPVRHFQPKKFNNQHRPQQNYPFVKSQVNTNNIVITGNDDQYRFNSRQNKNKGSFNKGSKSLSLRVVTPQPVSSSNVNLKIDHFDKEVDSKCLSSFLTNRVVSTQENLMQTNIVVVKNLATATTEPKLMKLCGGIGTVQKLQMATNERQATIHFDTVASAHKFYNKYRRYMIDLSMIQVDLVPCEGNS